MSLLSGLRGGSRRSAGVETARAVLVPAALVAGADGKVVRAELIQLANLCAFSPIFADHDGNAMVKLLEGIAADFRARGANAVMNEAVAALSPALRETAMAFAMRVAMADGEVGEEEQQMLMAMSRHMELPDELTDTIFAVIAILQRPATA